MTSPADIQFLPDLRFESDSCSGENIYWTGGIILDDFEGFILSFDCKIAWLNAVYSYDSKRNM